MAAQFNIGPDTRFLPSQHEICDESRRLNSGSRSEPMRNHHEHNTNHDDRATTNYTRTLSNESTNVNLNVSDRRTDRHQTRAPSGCHSSRDAYYAKAYEMRASHCNTTTLSIATCFIIAFSALGLAVYNTYVHSEVHGFGPHAMVQSGYDRNNEGGADGHQRYSQISGHPGEGTEEPPLSTRHEISTHMSSSFAHIVGEGEGVGVKDSQLDRFVFWRENVTQNVGFEAGSGVLVIKVPGYYYVYTQVYFVDSTQDAIDVDTETGRELPMIVSTTKNNAPILESVLTFTQYVTKYHGGTFYFEKGDEIGVRVSNGRLRISSNGGRTFFGLFMLSSSQPLISPS